MSAAANSYLTVPAGTRSGQCRGCDATIYWVPTRFKRMMPVDCDADEQCHTPTAAEEGVGLSHFFNHFRRRRA